MFEKGEILYYGTAGVCKVSDICRSPFDKNDDRMYYVLEPNDFSEGTIIYAPVENSQVLLRSIMTKQQAELLMSSLATMEPMEIFNEKHRREEYRMALRNGTPESIARIIKTVYLRKKTAVKMQKKASDTDMEYDKLARKALLGELATAMGTSVHEAEEKVNAAMKQ